MAPYTTPDVVNQLMSGLALLALSSPSGVPEGLSLVPLDGVDDAGQKQRNAIEVRYGNGQRFVIFIAPMNPESAR